MVAAASFPRNHRDGPLTPLNLILFTGDQNITNCLLILGTRLCCLHSRHSSEFDGTLFRSQRPRMALMEKLSSLPAVMANWGEVRRRLRREVGQGVRESLHQGGWEWVGWGGVGLTNTVESQTAERPLRNPACEHRF